MISVPCMNILGDPLTDKDIMDTMHGVGYNGFQVDYLYFSGHSQLIPGTIEPISKSLLANATDKKVPTERAYPELWNPSCLWEGLQLGNVAYANLGHWMRRQWAGRCLSGMPLNNDTGIRGSWSSLVWRMALCIFSIMIKPPHTKCWLIAI